MVCKQHVVYLRNTSGIHLNNTFIMKKYVDCHKVELRECEYGLGVFASQNISCGEMIENGITQPLVDVDGNKTGNEHLHTWSDDRKVWASSSGCLAWYNHSDTPNVKKIANLMRMIT